jgi:hypothetical protein
MRPFLVLFFFCAALSFPARADVISACKAQSGCRVAQQTAAGQGHDGEELGVTELVYKSPPPESWAAGLECRDGYREFWVTAGGVESLLLELCNDGYGASGVGEDEIEIGNNRLTHMQVGGSAWRWSGVTTYQLSPLGILKEAWDGFHTLGANYDTGQWDWTDYAQGASEWWAPFCDEQGYVPDNEGMLPDDAQIQHYLAIPQLAESSVPANILDASLGNCSLTLSSELGRGWIVHGEEAEAVADQAWMRLLAYEPNRLAVSVRLPKVLTGGKSWLSDDHIEIWQAPLTSYYDACLDQKAPARQWAVRLSDGAVFAAHGDPASLPKVLARHSTVDSQGGVIVTTHLELAEPLENLTVVLSRGDGKKKQRWLLASSDLSFGKPWTLGRTYAIAEDAASCAISEGRLDVTRWYRPPYQP